MSDGTMIECSGNEVIRPIHKPDQEVWTDICKSAMREADKIKGEMDAKHAKFLEVLDELLKSRDFERAPRYVLVTSPKVYSYKMWCFGSLGTTATFWDRGSDDCRYLAYQY